MLERPSLARAPSGAEQHGTPSPSLLRRRRGRAALPPGRRAPPHRAAGGQRAGAQARGRARRAAARTHPAQRLAHGRGRRDARGGPARPDPGRRRAARRASMRTTARSGGCGSATCPTPLPAAVPRLLRRFSGMAPRIRVTLETGAARRLLEDVREQRIDIAVACLPAPVVRPARGADRRARARSPPSPSGHPCAGEAAGRASGLGARGWCSSPARSTPPSTTACSRPARAAGIAPAIVEIAEPAVEQVLLAVASGAGRRAAPGLGRGALRHLRRALPAARAALAVVRGGDRRAQGAEHDDGGVPAPRGCSPSGRSAGSRPSPDPGDKRRVSATRRSGSSTPTQ